MNNQKVTNEVIWDYIEGALLSVSLKQALNVLESMGADIKHKFSGYHEWVLSIGGERVDIFSISEGESLQDCLNSSFYYEY